MQKKLEVIIEEKIKLESYIIDILDDAAYAERFISKPHNKNCPRMYRILDYCYDKKDLGYYDKPKMILRATPRQMTRYNLAIDIQPSDTSFELLDSDQPGGVIGVEYIVRYRPEINDLTQ